MREIFVADFSYFFQLSYENDNQISPWYTQIKRKGMVKNMEKGRILSENYLINKTSGRRI